MSFIILAVFCSMLGYTVYDTNMKKAKKPQLTKKNDMHGNI